MRLKQVAAAFRKLVAEVTAHRHTSKLHTLMVRSGIRLWSTICSRAGLRQKYLAFRTLRLCVAAHRRAQGARSNSMRGVRRFLLRLHRQQLGRGWAAWRAALLDEDLQQERGEACGGQV